MTSSNSTRNRMDTMGYPGDWDVETLRRNWLEFLTSFMKETETSLPLKRVQYQLEQSITYQEIENRWPRMSASERLDAWKRLLESSEQVVREILPTCVQCGECCRRSAPTLHREDLEILRQEKIPWNQLLTLRKGEPVRSPQEDKLIFLLDERIKFREKEGSQECVFFDNTTDQCMIYADRPLQCRAQACWDPSQSKELATQPYLSRRDILQSVEILLKMMEEHDERCSFAKLHAAFKKLEDSKGENIDEVLQLLAYEDHFRHFAAEQLNIPEDTLDLVFGRSFAEMVPIFGFRVTEEPDGTRCLVADRG
ncbi:YkgJ family cysteine cluster protein [Desulforhabdus amnigena]|uniref:YkgJ family cysteine cluster protein n=1 Tax=Desulforhabdus amnigena TaxID=40218 RepID=A0A9W6LAC9_9BACT|nr:YkgJ family cysteine cluster protein [Desulforhabdus amnigena]NLJ26469.1 YkgJ family cysteine cluster protein [Deltaproteobacteria bacterium]GLI35746.1 hypothetical protein DAMNIGENAA_31790 [Desulforhabdus amnigena]